MQRSADNRKVKPPFVVGDSALMMAAFAANKTICKSRKCCCRLCVKLKSHLRGIMWGRGSSPRWVHATPSGGLV